MLNERRLVLHERIGAALESIHAESLDDHLAELAHHYAHSGNPGKAIDYLINAATLSITRFGFQEAVNQLTSALEQVARLPAGPESRAKELAVRLALVRPLVFLTIGRDDRYGSINSERVLMLSPETNNRAGAVNALYGASLLEWSTGKLEQARNHAAQLLEIAYEEGSRVGVHGERGRGLSRSLEWQVSIRTGTSRTRG